MVEGEFISSKRQTTENRNATVNNPNGCFQNRLGAVCQGNTTAGTWSYQERTKHINVVELILVKLAILTFTKGKSVTSVLRTATSSQRNMGLSVSRSSSSYSRILTKQPEHLGRFKRLEIEPQYIFSDCENQRNTSTRPQNQSSVTKIHVLASRLR